MAKLLENTLRHGISRHSTYAFVNFGMFLCARGEAETGYAFGRTALLLSKAYPDRKSEAMLENMWSSFVQHWKEGYSACWESLARGLHAGLETGQYIWAFYCAANANTNSLLRGLPMSDILAEARSYQGLRRLDTFNAITWMIGAIEQIGHNLTTPTPRPADLVGERVDIHEVIRAARAIDNRGALFLANFYRVLLCVFQGAPGEAARIALETDPETLGVASWHASPGYYFYAGVAFTQSAREADPARRELYLEKAEAYAGKLTRWAALCPGNLAHRSALLAAEIARARGDTAAAWDRYDEAIRFAEEGAYVQDQVLGNELAARHFLALGKTTTARGYLAEASRLYDRWGAREATRRLARELPDLAPRRGLGAAAARRAGLHLGLLGPRRGLGAEGVAGHRRRDRPAAAARAAPPHHRGERGGAARDPDPEAGRGALHHRRAPRGRGAPARSDAARRSHGPRGERRALRGAHPGGRAPRRARGRRPVRRRSLPRARGGEIDAGLARGAQGAGSPACSTSRTTSPRAPSPPIAWSSSACSRPRSPRRSRTPSSTPSSSARSRSAPRSSAAPTRRSSRCIAPSRRARTRTWRRSAR